MAFPTLEKWRIREIQFVASTHFSETVLNEGSYQTPFKINHLSKNRLTTRTQTHTLCTMCGLIVAKRKP